MLRVQSEEILKWSTSRCLEGDLVVQFLLRFYLDALYLLCFGSLEGQGSKDKIIFIIFNDLTVIHCSGLLYNYK